MSGIGDPSVPPELWTGPVARRTGRVRPGSVTLSLLSTAVLFGVAAIVVVNSPGWTQLQRSFFNADIFWGVLPDLFVALWKNIQLFLLAEAGILVLALLLAVMRSLPGPVFFPVRLVAISYIDLFRAVPSVLVIYLLGFGVPALQIPGMTNDPFILGLVALIIVWSAYVAEVYRAGIDSVHPSQEAAARSLGLTRGQGLRFVVLPQAVRRVIPPLLNDFIGLQKDTALVSFIGVIEVFRRTQIEAGGAFNFTPYLACGLVFLLLTIPLARVVDYLVARDRRRYLAGVAR
jgi:polar amino acid transport system permease protein